MTTETIEVNIRVFVDKDNIGGDGLEKMRQDIEKDFANYFRGMPQNNRTIMGSVIETKMKGNERIGNE